MPGSGSRALVPMLVVFAATALLIVPAPAEAGTYTVSACSPSTSPGGWQPVDSFPEGLVAGNECGGLASGPNEPQGPVDEGALFAEDGPNIVADIPNGAEAGWNFAAPPGTSIASIAYWRSLHAYDQQSLVPGLWAGEGATLESCQSQPAGTHECNSLNNTGPRTFTGLNTGSLFFGVRCSLLGGGESCAGSGGADHFAQADLYSATVTLSEATSPTISSVSGAAWSGGTLSGQVSLTLTASDPSGIASIEVRSTLGELFTSAQQICDYYRAVPCPNLSGATVNLDTTTTPDGPQSLILVVRDAAGNTSTLTSPPLFVANHPPAPPTSKPPAPVPPPPPPGSGETKEKLRALIDSRGRLYLAGPIPASAKGLVKVCWRATKGRHLLGGHCVKLHVKRGRISVTFHPSAGARRGVITVSVSDKHRLLARLRAG